MIKMAMLAAGVAGSMSMNMVDTYTDVQGNATKVLAVYEAAAQINPYAGRATMREQNNNLFRIASDLDGFTNGIIRANAEANSNYDQLMAAINDVHNR